jgi:hypothetical protein
MKQKSTTRPIVVDDDIDVAVWRPSRRRSDEVSYASFSASTVSSSPRTKSSSSKRNGVVTDPSVEGFDLPS